MRGGRQQVGPPVRGGRLRTFRGGHAHVCPDCGAVCKCDSGDVRRVPDPQFEDQTISVPVCIHRCERGAEWGYAHEVQDPPQVQGVRSEEASA